MANKVLLKKSSVVNRVPVAGDLDYGELALNYADEKLYFKNSSNVIKSLNVTQSVLTIGTGLSGTSYNGTSAVTIAIDSTVATLTGSQTLTNKTLSSPTITGNITGDGAFTGNLKSLYSVGDEGGEIFLAKPQTNSTIAGTGVTIDVYQNKIRIFEQGGTTRGVFIDLTAAGAAVGSNLLSGGAVTVLALAGDTGTDNLTVGSDTLTLAGGTGLTSTVTNNTVTFDIDASVATLSGAQTLTNKTISAVSNTISGLTNANLSGTAAISNANLANSSLTIGTTAISLGASSTTLAGLTSVTSTSFVGALTGNASTATNVAYSGLTGTVPTWNQNTTGSAATLTTGRTIALTGDVTYTSGSFDGSANVTGVATLSNTGVTANTYTKVTVDAKGRVTSATTLGASDIPSLDASKITSGTIDAARLPSYVDDVVEGTNLAAFPVTGETGKIYVALDTNKTYRWSGSAYVYITSGAVDSVGGYTGVVTSANLLASMLTVDGAGSGLDADTLDGNHASAFYLASNPSGYTTNTGTVTGVTGTAPIISSGGTAPAISISAATTLAAGSMSAADKSKLDGIASGATANTGTVTSVSLTVPTGLSVAGSPITTSGTLAVTLTAGYSIPTTSSQTNWDSAFTDRLKWDGGSTGLVAATGRTSLGATTLGSSLFTLTNVAAIAFPRINADNTVSTLDAATFRTAIGAGTGTVTSVGGTGTVSGLTLSGTVTTTGNLTLGGTLSVLPSNFASQTANTFLSAPNGAAGTPTFRTIVAADIPTLNQNTTGTSANVTGIVAVANGGTGSSTAAGALTNLGAYAATNPSSYIALGSAITGYTAGTNTALAATDTVLAALGKLQGQVSARGTGTVTSVGGTGSYGGLTLTGTVTTTGNLTLGGTPTGTWPISVSGSAASATTATTATTATAANAVNSPDGDRNASTKLPTTTPQKVRFDFASSASAGTGGNYAGVMTYAPWTGDTASTGDASYQLAFGSTAANGGGIPQLNIRKGIDSTWNAWYTLIHTGNISTYSSSPTLQVLTVDSNGNLDYTKYDSSSTATINIKNIPLNFTGSGTLSFSSNDLILTL